MGLIERDNKNYHNNRSFMVRCAPPLVNGYANNGIVSHPLLIHNNFDICNTFNPSSIYPNLDACVPAPHLHHKVRSKRGIKRNYNNMLQENNNNSNTLKYLVHAVIQNKERKKTIVTKTCVDTFECIDDLIRINRKKRHINN